MTLNDEIFMKFGFLCRDFQGKAPFVGYIEMRSPRLLAIDAETVKTVMVSLKKSKT